MFVIIVFYYSIFLKWWLIKKYMLAATAIDLPAFVPFAGTLLTMGLGVTLSGPLMYLVLHSLRNSFISLQCEVLKIREMEIAGNVIIPQDKDNTHTINN
jgi:hypothetical protein